MKAPRASGLSILLVAATWLVTSGVYANWGQPFVTARGGNFLQVTKLSWPPLPASSDVIYTFQRSHRSGYDFSDDFYAEKVSITGLGKFVNIGCFNDSHNSVKAEYMVSADNYDASALKDTEFAKNEFKRLVKTLRVDKFLKDEGFEGIKLER